MAEDVPPLRLMNFVSQEQLEEAKKNRGERVEDGTAQRDRPLYEILKENKDKQDAEFNERLKHRPPKALDEDETEFLDSLHNTRKEYEQHIADEEAEELRRFQVAVAAQSLIVLEAKETFSDSDIQKSRTVGKKNPQPLGMIIKVKPQAKKARVEPPIGQKPSGASTGNHLNLQDSPRNPSSTMEDGSAAKSSLVLYSDGSDSDSSP